MRATLERLDIRYDEWYSQASIEESGKVAETIELFRQRGLVYEQDGAIWLRTTEVGDSRDRVLIKSNGDATYLAGDLAYHRDKFLVRNFDRVIDVFGADHHGQVASLKAGVAALGVSAGPPRDPARPAGQRRRAQDVEAVGQLHQARLGHRGVRAGRDQAAVASQLDRPGDDARPRPHEAPVDGEPGLLRAVRACPHRLDRPQAARARDRARPDRRGGLSASRARPRARAGPAASSTSPAPSPRPPETGRRTRSRAGSAQLAGEFHGFYHDCRVLSEEIPPELTQARLWLVEGVRIGLAIALGLLGVHAPDEM